MVYFPRPVFKTGISPNPMSLFNMSSLTPTQKLTLARCRIWKTFVNTGKSTGVNSYNRLNGAKMELDKYHHPLHDVS